MDEWTVLNWFADTNYKAMEWSNEWWWWCWIGLFFSGTLISMSPLSLHHEQSFLEIVSVWIRRVILFTAFTLICMPFIMLFVYDMAMRNELGDHTSVFLKWFFNMASKSPFESIEFISHWVLIVPAMMFGWTLRFCYNRYFLTFISSIARRLRRQQSDDKPSDILNENDRFKVKDFLPSKYYTDKGMVVGLDEDGKPIVIPRDTWLETNMQVIGPTRYGKGVILGCLMDQTIRKNNTLFYVDPKDDKFAAHVMYQACKETGRTFYYISMDDNEIGKWGPFMGGTEKDAFSRLQTALGLEMTGDPGTDYYKSQEITSLRSTFKKTRRIESMLNEIRNSEANKSEAELSAWKEVESLCPKQNKGFSIEKAIKENAVVYFKGSLDDRVIKTATKMFIVELVQECRRLSRSGEKKQHLTAVIDEVSFLVSRELKEALATIVGFGVNFVNAYQSQEDLVNTDDVNLNGRALKHSININSQIKAIYGGADYETAEWAASLSGTIVKEVTKMERTDIKAGGGETWEGNRTIGHLEENLIHPNVVLTLPPRVCVFIQPRQLLKPLFSSFVPVKDMNALKEFLVKKQFNTNQHNTPPPLKNEQSENEDHSEEIQNFQEMVELTESKEFDDSFTPGGNLKTNKEELDTDEDSISHAKSDITGMTVKPEIKLEPAQSKENIITSSESSVIPSDKNKPALDNDEAAKKREKNKARKAKQKQRRKNSNENEPVVAGLTEIKKEQMPEPEVKTSQNINENIIDHDGLDAFLESVQPDDMTLKVLSDEEEV